CFCPDSATDTTHSLSGGSARVTTTARMSARDVKCRCGAAKAAFGFEGGNSRSVRATIVHMRTWSMPRPVTAHAHPSHTRSDRARRCAGSVNDLPSNHFFAGAVSSTWRAHIAHTPAVAVTPSVARWGRPANSHTITAAFG